MTDYPPPPNPEYPSFEDALKQVAEEAANNPSLTRCMNCSQPGFYYPADKAYAHGHCYSEAGRDEFIHISQCCEYCFDAMFKEFVNEDTQPLIEPDEEVQANELADGIIEEPEKEI